jgi:hypothetical protein
MKTLLKIIGFVLMLLFISCDHETQYDFFITNKCKGKVNIFIKDRDDQELNIEIEAEAKKLVYTGEGLVKIFDSYIEKLFKEIIITKGSDTSKINYINKDLWNMQVSSKYHADVYLTVTEEDFE